MTVETRSGAFGSETIEAGTGIRRDVFYIHGLDPRGPRVYEALLKEGAQKSEERVGRRLTLSPRRKAGQHASRLEIGAEDVKTGRLASIDYVILRWDDLVRKLWTSIEPIDLLRSGFRVFAFILAHRREQLRRFGRQGLSGLGAIIVLPCTILICALIATLGSWAAYALVSALVASLGGGGALQTAFGLATVAGALAGAVAFWRFAAGRTNLLWLLRSLDHQFATAQGERDLGVERTNLFADRFVERWRATDAEEIVVIGHSFGALLLVRMMARALREEPEIGRSGPRVVILTLGQTIPFYNVLGDDAAFREDLRLLGTTDRLTFFDVTSGSDPCSSCRVPILQDLGVPEDEVRIIQREPDFHDMLEPDSFDYIRMHPLDFHFQYLKPSERGFRFDYFELLSRPERLTSAVREAP